MDLVCVQRVTSFEYNARRNETSAKHRRHLSAKQSVGNHVTFGLTLPSTCPVNVCGYCVTPDLIAWSTLGRTMSHYRSCIIILFMNQVYRQSVESVRHAVDGTLTMAYLGRWGIGPLLLEFQVRFAVVSLEAAGGNGFSPWLTSLRLQPCHRRPWG